MESGKGVGRMKLGSQGLEVSAQGLGCNGMSGDYGPPKTEPDMISLIHHAVSSGITFLDTADMYGPFTNELLLGKALKGIRKDAELATKFGISFADGKSEIRGDPSYVRACCEASLKRLDVDCIDLYYQHRIDTRIPIEITIGELKKLVEEGKIKYIGLSEASPSTIRRAHAVHPITAVQLEWSLWTRDVEEEIVPICRELGIGIVTFCPLGRGFLSSGPKVMNNLSNQDFRKFLPRFQAANVKHNAHIFDRVNEMATRKGCTPSQLALAWIHHQGNDVCPIPGTTKIENLNQNIGALSVKLTSEEMAELATLADAVKGDRYGSGASTWRQSDTPALSSWKVSSLLSSMGSGERIRNDHKNGEKIHQNRTICSHSFSDLSHVSPAIFVYLLKESYVHGTHKATLKFRILQQQVLQALQNGPQPGPATFVVHCLYLLPLYGPPYSEGFSHLLMSSLRRLQSAQRTPADSSQAKSLAAQLFLDVLTCFVIHEERILVKLLENFELGLEDIAEVICGLEVNNEGIDIAKACVERYIFGFIESQSYMTAVTLLEHFSIRQSGQSFLLRMLQDNQFKAAEKWATFMGKPMICVLVQKYLDLKMLKNAYEIIKQNNLRQEFPDAYHLYKESSLKKLAEKGCWDVAEIKTNNDRQLVEYLVYLAMEAGYTEKVDELCERYSLKGFVKVTGPEASPPQTRYLHLTELVIEDIIWVDEVDGLLNATSHIERCKVVGVDCEWKPNYEKGSKPNKVSIMQIASERMVFILDLIKLSTDKPNVLDDCLKRILRSPRILKLGYNLQCDLQQLSHSYGELECFKYYEMLLDIQKLFNETRGGLSGLAKKILGAGLNKTRRNSNWEQRPLSQNQMEYAALDAAVLIHIFHHVGGQPQPMGLKEERAKVEWKSHIVSHMGNTKPPLKMSKS